jgi:hypothetical protein
MESHSVFFSWQSDTPTEWGRNFIERALTAAKEKLVEDLEIDPAIRDAGMIVDMDTRGVAGTPPIVDTIFGKIDAASAFVADLTFIGKRRDGRPTPNPNVLLEYGWALKSRGYSRIVVLMNTAYGEPSDKTLPFNMKHLRRPITFHLPEGADDAAKQKARSGLVDKLKVALRAIVESPEFKNSLPKPPVTPAFAEMQPADGSARFRARNEPIGVVEGPFGMGEGHEVTLADGAAIWLRVMPDKAQPREWTIAELRNNVSSGGRVLLPLGSFSGSSRMRAVDGFGNVPAMSNHADRIPAAVVAFKSGEVWSVYCGPLSSIHQNIPNMEPMFVECFIRCAAFLRDGLKISTPYRWIAGIEGLKGKKLHRIAPPGRSYWDQYTGPCLQDVVMDRGTLSGTDKVQLGLRPFFRKLYDAFGVERGDHMDEILTQQFPD